MSEVRPIDANALKEALKCGAYSSVLKLIDRQPTLDNEPVVHAHWIKDDKESYEQLIQRHCSNCGNVLTQGVYQKVAPFCCHCGAKMDEEVNNVTKL